MLVQQPAASGGAASWSVDQGGSRRPPIFETFSVVRGDAKTYVLQIVTRTTVDGTPLSVTQVTVDRASGKALKSVHPRQEGRDPHAGERPSSAPSGERARAPPKRSRCRPGASPPIKAPHRNGTVWVSDQVPALGIVKGVFPDGQLELVEAEARRAHRICSAPSRCRSLLAIVAILMFAVAVFAFQNPDAGHGPLPPLGALGVRWPSSTIASAAAGALAAALASLAARFVKWTRRPGPRARTGRAGRAAAPEPAPQFRP